MEKKKVAVLCIAIAATVCFITYVFTSSYIRSRESVNEIRVNAGSYEDLEKYMDISDLEGIIERYYYLETDDAAMTDGALKGMVGSLSDPYSAYYTEDEYKDYLASTEASAVGIGVTASPVSRDSGYLKVLNVYKGGPASEGGILTGDIIMAVDGVNIAGIDFEGALNLLSGPSGSSVVVTVATAGEAREVTLMRRETQAPYAFYSMLDDKIGYITISEFKGNCVEEFRDSLEKLVTEEEAQGVVIDLRGNIGGSISSTIDILDQILPEGLAAFSVGKDGERTEYSTDSDYNSLPLAVVVNNGTVSAGEIFAGAVQDTGRGKIIGERTFGKGVAQTVVDMPYSAGGVKLSTAEYYTPQGNRINLVGIMPDEEVALPAGQEISNVQADTQLQAAKAAVYEVIDS